MSRGKQLLEKRDYSRALLEYRNAAKAMPRDAEAYFGMGMAAMGNGDFQNAYNALETAVALNPGHHEAKLRLAQLMASVGDPESVKAAEQSTLEELALNPNDPEMLRTLALAQLKLGNADTAVQTLEKAVVSAPKVLAPYLLLAQTNLYQGDTKAAEETLKKATAAVPDAVEPQLALARLYRSQNRNPEAETAIRRALQLDPKSGGPLRELAFLQAATGRKAEAEENFKKLSSLGVDTYKTIYGIFLFSENRQQEGVQEFERVLKSDPGNRSARTLLVSAYQAVGRSADATKLLEAALKKNHKDLEALFQRAEMFVAAKKFDDAVLDLNQLLKFKPDSAEAYYWLAKSHQGQNLALQYRQDLFKSLELNPALNGVRVELATALIAANQPKDALSVLDSPNAQPGSLAILAMRNWALWGLRDFAGMRKGIDQGLSQSRAVEFLIQDGMWRLQAGDPVKGRASLEEALKIAPGNLRAMQGVKDSYVLQRQAPMAVQKVKEYAAQQPKSPEAQEFLGFTLWGSGDRQAARTAFANAKAADPQFTHADLALVQLDAVEAKWDDASAKLKTLLASNPDNATARLWLGDIQAMRGSNAEALENFRKLIESNTANAQALNNFAYLLAEHANKPEEALKYAEKAVESAPNNPDYVDTLGWILYRKGLYGQALPKLRQAAMTGKNPVAKYHLAMAYGKAGDVQKGRTVLAEALKMNSKLPEAQMAGEILGPVK